MKSLTGRMLMIAAAVTVVTGVASAQKLAADVPFSFRAGTAMLPAGSYAVSTNHLMNGSAYVSISNRETRKTVMAVPITQIATNRSDVPTKLVFGCDAGRCALIEIWNGAYGTAQQFAKPAGHAEWSRIVEVPLSRATD